MPVMLLTGAKDRSVIGKATPESRREVFAALPVGSKFELLLKDAEHLAFSARAARGGEQRNPNHHRLIQAMITAFREASLNGNKQARAWLDGKKPRALLEPGDVWRRK